MFHQDLYPDNYKCDPFYTKENYGFIKANPEVKSNYDTSFFKEIIFEDELPIYDPHLQKATYMAPSIIYHAYKNNFHKDLDYIGFLEYDILLIPEDKSPTIKSVTRHTKDILNANKRVIIFYRHQHVLKTYYEQDINLSGKNAIVQIFEDYNSFWNTKYDYRAFLNNKVCSQQSFLTDRQTFIEIMKFISFVIENRLAERPHSFRRPSTLLDRYIAVALMLHSSSEKVSMSLKHSNLKQWKDPGVKKYNFLKELKEHVGRLLVRQ